MKLLLPAGTKEFGSIAVAGDTLVVGAPSNSTNTGYFLGAAYVFSRKTSGAWEQMQRLVASDAESDHFSSDIAFDGDTLLIGASGAAYTNDDGSAGAAYVFTLQAGLWRENQKLTAMDGVTGDKFGYNVAIHGDTLVVGAVGDQEVGIQK